MPYNHSKVTNRIISPLVYKAVQKSAVMSLHAE